MTLSINHCGYPALLYFALITLIPMSKFDAIFLDLCKYPEMVFRWYLFEKIFYKPKVQLSYFLFDMPLFKTTPSLFKMIFVFKNFSGFTSIVNFIFEWKLFKASNKTSYWDSFHQQIIYRMEGSLVFLLYYFILWYVCHRTTHCTAIYLQKLGLNWIIQYVVDLHNNGLNIIYELLADLLQKLFSKDFIM